MQVSEKVAFIAKDCVACGSCVQVCPKSALRMNRGIRAEVDAEKCIGCGKCAKVCPAAVISLESRGAV